MQVTPDSRLQVIRVRKCIIESQPNLNLVHVHVHDLCIGHYNSYLYESVF